VASFTPRPLYPQRKSPWYPLDKRLGGPPNLYQQVFIAHIQYVITRLTLDESTVGGSGMAHTPPECPLRNGKFQLRKWRRDKTLSAENFVNLRRGRQFMYKDLSERLSKWIRDALLRKSSELHNKRYTPHLFAACPYFTKPQPSRRTYHTLVCKNTTGGRRSILSWIGRSTIYNEMICAFFFQFIQLLLVKNLLQNSYFFFQKRLFWKS
jgi:hypothetical protein